MWLMNSTSQLYHSSVMRFRINLSMKSTHGSGTEHRSSITLRVYLHSSNHSHPHSFTIWTLRKASKGVEWTKTASNLSKVKSSMTIRRFTVSFSKNWSYINKTIPILRNSLKISLWHSCGWSGGICVWLYERCASRSKTFHRDIRSVQLWRK